MSGSKPRRGLASFLSNELKEPQAPEVAPVSVSVPPPAPVPDVVAAPKALSVAPPDPEVIEAVDEVTAPVKPRAAKGPSSASGRVARAPTVSEREPAKKAAKRAPKKAPRALKAAKKAPVKTSAKTAKTRTAKKAPKAPLYLRLTRKEARLREDQIDGLAKVARRLTRAKGGSGTERLTENTLLRVAVDLLLAHADALEGVTESQLRASVLGK